MIRTAREEFDRLLGFLVEQVDGGSTACQVERVLFARLPALGRMLLEILFETCAQRSA